MCCPLDSIARLALASGGTPVKCRVCGPSRIRSAALARPHFTGWGALSVVDLLICDTSKGIEVDLA
uniref:hypothetical protein n=1 Tax=Mycobacterium tuberculosis TaxID=1773 RepID=UPI00254F0C31